MNFELCGKLRSRVNDLETQVPAFVKEPCALPLAIPYRGATLTRKRLPLGPYSRGQRLRGAGASLLDFLLLSSQFKKNHFTWLCSGSEAGSYLRLADSCVTQLKAQGPSRTCNESEEEEEVFLLCFFCLTLDTCPR